MGSALLAGWREQGALDAVVVDPAPAAAALAGPAVRVVATAGQIPSNFAPQAVVIAVKPQMATAALQGYGGYHGAVFVSIMAGKTIASITALLGGAPPVVRAMPNTPAAIRRGITVGCAGPGVTAAQHDLANRLLAAVGSVAWVEREGLIDAVTAVSGSGPAYVFLLAELMEQAAIAQGLPPGLSRRLARETVAGAGALMMADETSSAGLRQAVTSPNGTTQAALDVLMAPAAMPRLVNQAIAAATLRSRELAG